jgi:hypothetical protein
MSTLAAGRRAGWVGAALIMAFAVPILLARPYWQTVDDAFMAMVAHGYVGAAWPSPALVFSSVLYGGLIQLVGVQTLAGVQTYGAFTYAMLAAAAASSGYALWRRGVPGPLAAAALVAVFAPAALYPQFTVVAGMLAVSALMLLAAGGRPVAAVIAALLLVLAALVRAEAAVFTLLLTSPLWAPPLWRASRPRRRAGIAALAVLVAATAATILADRLYYSAEAWQQFSAMNSARIRFTDYGLRQYFFREPLEAMRLGWTPNDLVMVEGWFFADPRVFTAARIDELASYVSLPGWILTNAARFPEALAPFREPSFLVLLAFALLVAWPARSRSTLRALGVLAAAIMVLYLAGRPGITRIYVAPLAGIVLLSLVAHPLRLARWQGAVLALCIGLAAITLGVRNAEDRLEEKEARTRLCKLPSERLYVVWGERLHYEKLYRPLSAPGDNCPLRVYPLAVHTYAPYAVHQLRAATGAGDVVGALLDGNRLDMIAEGWQIDVLRRHLRIHYGRNLAWRLLSGDGGRGSWFEVRVLPTGSK